MWPFRRKRDPFLELLLDREWRCAQCDELHKGMLDIGAIAPDPWQGARDYEPNSQLAMDRNFLSEDFCVLDGEHFLVRCVLYIPVHGLDRGFGYGCWGSLQRDNFQSYVDRFDDRDFEHTEPWFSWLANQLLPYVGDETVACSMYPQPSGKRPQLEVNDKSHPLAIAQRDGISPEAVLDIYRAYGHAPAIH